MITVHRCPHSHDMCDKFISEKEEARNCDLKSSSRSRCSAENWVNFSCNSNLSMGHGIRTSTHMGTYLVCYLISTPLTKYVIRKDPS